MLKNNEFIIIGKLPTSGVIEHLIIVEHESYISLPILIHK